MAYLKFTPDLFLGTAELNRLKQFIDDNGFRKNILENTVSFGLIKSSKDLSFANGKVEKDVDNIYGQRTIKIKELFGIDKNGSFLHLDPQYSIAVPNDGNWYWVKVKHAINTLEKGRFSISGNGDLTDTSGSAELTKLFRGMPNFPSRIRFKNSAYNTLEYDVLDVIDDQNAVLQHPATNTNGISEFTPETDLQIEIVGTFTQGVAIPEPSKVPFNYDSASVQLVVETAINQAPAFIKDEEFYLARIQATNITVIIQDKRTEYWETKGSSLHLEIDRGANPLIGVESVQFDSLLSSSDKNIVKVAWGMRSDNWAIDSSNNIVTFNSGLGGKYKSVNDFQSGDLVGGRLYAPNGKYGRIVATVKQGSAINFHLDVLDVNNFSNDGGVTLIAGSLIASPDADSIEIQFIPDPADNYSALKQTFTFPISDLVGRCDVLVYKDPSVFYNVQYRYKSFKEYTEYKAIPSDPVGYYTEASFNNNGNLKPFAEQVLFPYVSDPTAGFIKLVLSANAISKFRTKVDKGDLIGTQDVNVLTGLTTIDLEVGVTSNYIYVSGNHVLSNDIYFNVKTANAVKGNEFRIHFECAGIDLNGKTITIVENYGTAGQRTIKEITQGDIYEMLNQEKGIVITLKYLGAEWVAYQNYSLGVPSEITMWEGDVALSFDAGTQMGKIQGLFGWKIHTVMAGRTPVGFGDVLDDNGLAQSFAMGDSAGELKHKLTVGELAKHKHNTEIPSRDFNNGATDGPDLTGTDGGATTHRNFDSTEVGNDEAHNNLQPYYVVAFIKKQF